MKSFVKNNYSFWDHVEAMRWRLLWIVAAWILGTVICFSFSNDFIAYATRSIGKPIFLSLFEGFNVRFFVAFILGVVVSLPVWIYHIMRFLWSGLQAFERKILLLSVSAILWMSFVGIIFGDRVLMPMAVEFLLNFGRQSMEPMLSAQNFLSIYFCILLFCCLIFNLPFVIIGLAFLKLLNLRTLIKYRKHVCVGSFILSAIITPPDMITQLLMAMPLYILYELSILGVKVFIKRRNVAA